MIHQIRFHQNPAVRDRCSDQEVMHRGHQCLSLSDTCLQDFPCLCARLHLEGAPAVRNVERQTPVKQQLLRKIPVACQIKLCAEVRERSVAGVCKRLRKVLGPMSRLVVALDLIILK